MNVPPVTVCVQEIVDETDRYVDNLRLQRVNAALLTSNLPKHLQKYASGLLAISPAMASGAEWTFCCLQSWHDMQLRGCAVGTRLIWHEVSPVDCMPKRQNNTVGDPAGLRGSRSPE